MSNMKKESISQKIEEYLPSKEAGESALVREAEEAILEKLEKKIAAVRRIKELIDTTRSDESPEEVAKIFYGYLDEVFSYDPEAYQTLPEAKEIGENGDARFLRALREGCASLIRKFEYRKEIQNNREKLFERLETSLFSKEKRKRKVRRDKIKDIRFDPFAVNIIFNATYFSRLRKEAFNWWGFHIHGTPFNIIRALAKEQNLSSTIEHEKIHNFLEGFLPSVEIYPSKRLASVLINIPKLRLIGAPQTVIEKEKELLFKLSSSSLVNQLHEEMIADIDGVDTFSLVPFFKEELFEERKRANIGFATAAREMEKMTSLLEAGSEDKDETVRAFCHTLNTQINERFNRAAQIMRKLLFVSHKLGSELEVRALLTLLEPTKFHHIDHYLTSSYGKEAYRGFASLYEIILDQPISLSRLQNILSVTDRLSSRDKRMLKGQLQDFRFAYQDIPQFNLRGLEDMRQYNSAIETLSSKLDISPGFSKEFQENMMEIFFWDRFKQGLPSNFQDLPEFIGKLNEEERRVFGKALEHYFGGDFLKWDLKEIYEGEEVTSGFIKSLPLWNVLADLKLDAVAQKGLDAYEEYLKRFRDEKEPQE